MRVVVDDTGGRLGAVCFPPPPEQAAHVQVASRQAANGAFSIGAGRDRNHVQSRALVILIDNEGVAFLPRMCVEQEIEQKLVNEVRVKEIQVERKIRLIYPTKRALSHAARAFLEVVG